jgi:hypothetical protein
MDLRYPRHLNAVDVAESAVPRAGITMYILSTHKALPQHNQIL